MSRVRVDMGVGEDRSFRYPVLGWILGVGEDRRKRYPGLGSTKFEKMKDSCGEDRKDR